MHIDSLDHTSGDAVERITLHTMTWMYIIVIARPKGFKYYSQRVSFTQKWNCVFIYYPSCHSKPAILIFRTQIKIF